MLRRHSLPGLYAADRGRQNRKLWQRHHQILKEYRGRLEGIAWPYVRSAYSPVVLGRNILAYTQSLSRLGNLFRNAPRMSQYQRTPLQTWRELASHLLNRFRHVYEPSQ